MQSRLQTIQTISKYALGLMAFLAGLDKFLNLLTNWEQYVSPLAQRMLPLSPSALMHVVGVIEMVVGVAILPRRRGWGLTWRRHGWCALRWRCSLRATSSILPCAIWSWL